MDITEITPASEFWPSQLYDLDDMPEKLYVSGNVELLHRPSVAIVGSRRATAYGEHVAGWMATSIAAQCPVISGGAYGIDAAAHRGAIATGGKTIVVFAGGPDKPYPAGNTRLFEQIAERGGLFVSEVEPGTTPNRERFLDRNRLIAALSVGMVVVEAAQRSGTANAAGWARMLKRPLMAVPGPVTSAMSAGCHDLIGKGAALVDSADAVFKILGTRAVLPAMGEIERVVYSNGSHGCGCGIPNKAQYYVDIVITRDVPGGTETQHVDWYACAEHCDDWHPERMLNPGIKAQGWRVVEAKAHELRAASHG